MAVRTAFADGPSSLAKSSCVELAVFRDDRIRGAEEVLAGE